MISRISKGETQLILNSQDHVRRNDFKLAGFDSTDYYLLSDGKVLLDFKDADYSTVFETEHEFLEFVKKAKGSPSHILENFPAEEKDFLDTIETSRCQLENILAISNLDFSFRSLKKMDSACKNMGISCQTYLKDLFPLLVYYVSQTIINEMKAKWRFIRGQQNVLEPYIVLPSGKEINVFVDLYEDAIEDFENFSIFSTAQLRLHEI